MAPFLIALLVLGGGASLAAKNAVPGDMLYGVKVGFNENLRTSLSFSDASKAHWDAIREGRRLDEAAKLKAEGKLDAKTESELRTRFNSYAEDYDKRMDKLQSDKNSAHAEQALKINSELEAMLASHQQSSGNADSSMQGGMNAEENKDGNNMHSNFSSDFQADLMAHLTSVRSNRAMLQSMISVGASGNADMNANGQNGHYNNSGELNADGSVKVNVNGSGSGSDDSGDDKDDSDGNGGIINRIGL